MEKRDVILALDFDGTLYPIIDHDSEQMLALKVRNSSNKEMIDHFIDSDKRGKLSPKEFNALFEKHLKGHDEGLVENVIEDILSYFDRKNLIPLKEIVEKENVHLAVLSCGTDLLIYSFLKKTDLLEHKEHILAKEMKVIDGKMDGLIYHVKDIKDKGEKIKELRALYEDPVVVAVGDGPTDYYMLKEADRPFIITWEKEKCSSQFPAIANFLELKNFLELDGII